jgi:hypothetical protein
VLKLSTLLSSEGLDLGRVKLIRHIDSNLKGRTLFDVWHSAPEVFCEYQSFQAPKYKILKGDILTSFIVTNSGDTLFVGCYDVLGVEAVPAGVLDPVRKAVISEKYRKYDLSEAAFLMDYKSRLVIRRWNDAINIVKSATQTDPEILEIKAAAYDEPFPGHMSFTRRLSEAKLYTSWHEPLKVKGVYLLTFDDGSQYVGSASGADGFLGRWNNYLANGHGGNKYLKDRDARQATMSILEVAASRDVEKDILALEEMWKLKLGTRVHGLNA